MSENLSLTIKGERLSSWTQQTNVKSCKISLNNEKFFEQLGTNPTLSYAKEVKQKIDDLKNECVTKQKRLLGSEKLNHKQLYFTSYLKYIKYSSHSHLYDLLFLVLTPANAFCRNMLIFSYYSKLKKCKSYIRALKTLSKNFHLSKMFIATVFLLKWKINLMILTPIIGKVQEVVLKN